MIFIDYLTVSLAEHNSKLDLMTLDVLGIFAQPLPTQYKNTCREVMIANGPSNKTSQYGITVFKQYGSGLDNGWKYVVHLSGDYFHAIERDVTKIIHILSQFESYRIARLDLARDVCILLEEWQNYYINAFNSGKNVVGIDDARTVYYGKRTSQFFTRVYNKTAQDPIYYPAHNGYIIVRFEIEIKRIRGEQVFEHAFNLEYTNKLFLQRVRTTAKADETKFITNYFDNDDEIIKIKTVKRVVGNLENTVMYVLDAYRDYIIALLNNEAMQENFMKDDVHNNTKAMKILSVLNSVQPNNLTSL